MSKIKKVAKLRLFISFIAFLQLFLAQISCNQNFNKNGNGYAYE